MRIGGESCLAATASGADAHGASLRWPTAAGGGGVGSGGTGKSLLPRVRNGSPCLRHCGHGASIGGSAREGADGAGVGGEGGGVCLEAVCDKSGHFRASALVSISDLLPREAVGRDATVRTQ
eukprot:COSAG01_NODE_7713_length_3088_cov_1.991971_2_plen_122_part_00